MHTLRVQLAATIAVVAVAVASSAPARAYDSYSVARDATNCRACHGDFHAPTYTSLADGLPWGDLHDLHRFTILGGDCSTCHGATRFPVSTHASVGGAGLASIACIGCHGRAEDDVAASPEVAAGRSGFGAGLRQHHVRAGATVCTTCHLDASPAAYTPVGEEILPPYYAAPGTGHPSIPTSSCSPMGEEDFAGAPTGLDNDGDLVRDTMDPDCSVLLPTGSPCALGTACASTFCVDGVCCDERCGGGTPLDCRACASAAPGVPDGTCSDVSAAAGHVCRASAGVCDAAEICGSAAGACPSDALAPPGTPCRASSGTCDVVELCGSAAAACPSDALAPPGTPCRVSSGTCDVVELCTGASATCPTDGRAPDGVPCDDGVTCVEAETCTGGVCGGGAALSCDDGEPCTLDACLEPTGCSSVATSSCDDTGGPFDAGAADSGVDGGVDAAGLDAVADLDTGVGRDVGAGDPDAGLVDAAPPRDASAFDASRVDGSAVSSTPGTGCGCAVPHARRAEGALFPVVVSALGLVLRRRSRIAVR